MAGQSIHGQLVPFKAVLISEHANVISNIENLVRSFFRGSCARRAGPFSNSTDESSIGELCEILQKK